MNSKQHQTRTPSASAVETTHLVLPPDTNALGTAFGGRIMQWMDIAAGICAERHSRRAVVTAAVDDMHFARAIRLGDIVIIRASVNFTGRTSMEVGVRVDREERHGEYHEHCLTAYFTFVALNDERHPVPVPAIEPQSEDEKRRYHNADTRRRRRLQNRRV